MGEPEPSSPSTVDRKEAAMVIVEQIDEARNMVLDFEHRNLTGWVLDDYEAMRIACDRLLREASLRVAVLAEG
jgi:hypothetical protein